MSSIRLARPAFSRHNEAYRYTWEDIGVRAEFDRFQDKSEGIYAEMVVASIMDEAKPSLLHAGRLNLLSAVSRQGAVRSLQAMGANVDWNAALEQACFLAVQEYRNGEPAIDLRTVDPYERPRWLVKPYLEHGGPTVLFAPGGTGKTYLAGAIAITAASGRHVAGWLYGDPQPALFLDWETDKWAHAERLQAICVGAGIKERPPIYYRRMYAPLAESASSVRKEAERLGAGMVVYDSLGAACGGELESAETVLKFFNAVRSIGRPALVVSHVSKATANAPRNQRLSPFGSIYSENAARNTWSMHRAGDEDSDQAAVALIHEKTNNGRYQKRHAYSFQFDNVLDDDENEILVRVEIKAVSMSDVPEFDVKQSLPDRITACLKGGSLTPQEIAERLDAPGDSVRARLKDLRNQHRVIQLSDKRYGLMTQGAAS